MKNNSAFALNTGYVDAEILGINGPERVQFWLTSLAVAGNKEQRFSDRHCPSQRRLGLLNGRDFSKRLNARQKSLASTLPPWHRNNSDPKRDLAQDHTSKCPLEASISRRGMPYRSELFIHSVPLFQFGVVIVDLKDPTYLCLAMSPGLMAEWVR